MTERTPATLRLCVPLLLALLVAGCGGQVISTVFEDVGEVTPETTPAGSASGDIGYTDAEQAEILAENIDRMYAEDTQYTWYPAFVELTVRGGLAYVTTTLTEADTDVAGSMCQDIAAAAFENFIEPIGVADVQIAGAGGEDLADCDVPER